MRFNVIRAAALCAMVAGGAMVGCANKTEGERTLERAAEVEQAGNMITRGEQREREADAMIARGRTAKAQGDEVEGNRLINEGEAEKRKARADIAQGRKIKS